METITSDRAKYITAILSLTFICEIMFHINNKIIQSIGICILPMIFVYGVLLFKNEKK
jgi:hypothetical protein